MTDIRNLPAQLQDSIEVELISYPEQLHKDAECRMMMTRFSFSQMVRIEIEEVQRAQRLSYRQIEGLFSLWKHTLKFETHGNNETLVTDIVSYRLPFGILGLLADDLLVREDMKIILQKRLDRVKSYFEEASEEASPVVEA